MNTDIDKEIHQLLKAIDFHKESISCFGRKILNLQKQKEEKENEPKIGDCYTRTGSPNAVFRISGGSDVLYAVDKFYSSVGNFSKKQGFWSGLEIKNLWTKISSHEFADKIMGVIGELNQLLEYPRK